MALLLRFCSLRIFAKIIFTIYIFVCLFALFNYNTRIFEDNLQSLFDPKFTNMDGKCTPSFHKLHLNNEVDPYKEYVMSDIEGLFTEIKSGGQWAPTSCKSIQSILVIIPYRGRYKQLVILLKRLHVLLQKQLADYQILVVEQFGDEEFNRGMLFNIGTLESLHNNLRNHHHDNEGNLISPYCLIFHDVDLLPEHDANLYYCDNSMRHLAAGINEQRYRPMYYEQTGGVCSISTENMIKINGFSNSYWGWGNEDDDFSVRGREFGLSLSRPPLRQARYKMIRHHKAWRSLHNIGMDLLLSWKERWKMDGISSLIQKNGKKMYNVKSLKLFPLYTHLLVDIGKRPPPPIIKKKQGFLWLIQFFYP